MKRRVLFLAVIAIVMIGCSKSEVEVSKTEKLWKSPAGIIMAESDITNWENIAHKFKENIMAQESSRIKPDYYTSRRCETPQIRCGLECIKTENWRDADCIKASICAPCMNCCIQNPF